MTDLVACLSSGKGTWSFILRLIKEESWDNVILITNQFGKENFKFDCKFDLVVIDFNKPMSEIIKEIQAGIKGKLNGFEVAVNLISGTGKEHMAIMSALLKLGLAVRFVTVSDSGVKEI